MREGRLRKETLDEGQILDLQFQFGTLFAYWLSSAAVVRAVGAAPQGKSGLSLPHFGAASFYGHSKSKL